MEMLLSGCVNTKIQKHSGDTLEEFSSKIGFEKSVRLKMKLKAKDETVHKI